MSSRPTRTDALLAPFAEKTGLKWSDELKVPRSEVEDFLYSGASVEHNQEKRVVAAPRDCRAVRGIEDRTDLIGLKVLNAVGRSPFEGHGK